MDNILYKKDYSAFGINSCTVALFIALITVCLFAVSYTVLPPSAVIGRFRLCPTRTIYISLSVLEHNYVSTVGVIIINNLFKLEWINVYRFTDNWKIMLV